MASTPSLQTWVRSIVILALFMPTVLAPPGPLQPEGNIFDRTPTYLWSKLAGASHYQIQLQQGSTVIYTQTVPAGANCEASTCSFTPGMVLDLLKTYKWRVRPRVSASWGSYSGYRTFVVNPAGFDSQFTVNANGWSPVNGTWNLVSGKYQSMGLDSKITSAKFSRNYWDLIFTVRMKRSGCHECYNSVFFHGSGEATVHGVWTNGYRFGVANNTLWDLGRSTNGVFVTLAVGSSSAITSDWNTVEVRANGDELRFYVNGTLVHSGIYDSPPSKPGKVGIGFERIDATSGNRLMIDWATLVVPPTSSSLTLEN